jgi:diguanylate cyclase (GGDEF)-like protein
VFQANLKGHLNLWLNLPSSAHLWLWWLSASATFVLGFAFARSFLAARVFAPKMYGVLTSGMVLGAIIPVLAWLISGAAANMYAQFLGLVVPPVMLIAGGASYKAGYRPARYFFLAWLAFAFCLYAYVLQGLGVLAANRFNAMSFTIGAAGESLLLAFALADRIESLRREKEAVEARETLYQSLSLMDGLTGLHNRRYLARKLKNEIELARRHHYPLSLIMLDLDDFKSFNDRFGHVEGDRVLFAAAEAIGETVRDGDAACRYGGEEFTIVLPRAKAEQAGVVAERVRQAVAGRLFEPNGGSSVQVTISAGYTELAPDDDDRSVLDRADQALYRAKRGGKNQTVRG